MKEMCIRDRGNARPELKLEADYVTTDCDKDGIYNACKHFGWID